MTVDAMQNLAGEQLGWELHSELLRRFANQW
jgi:hypothetical protein